MVRRYVPLRVRHASNSLGSPRDRSVYASDYRVRSPRGTGRWYRALSNVQPCDTVRRECLDKTLFWNERDLERKLLDFKNYYNRHRTHDALDGVTPAMRAELTENKIIDLNNFHWKSHCRGLYQTPMAA